MKMRHAATALAALASSVACIQQPPPMPSPPPLAPAPAIAPATASAPVGTCNADAAQFAVGKLLDAALTEQARTRSGAQRVRVVRPGQMMTMDFDEQRLTLQLDAFDRVATARCG